MTPVSLVYYYRTQHGNLTIAAVTACEETNDSSFTVLSFSIQFSRKKKSYANAG